MGLTKTLLLTSGLMASQVESKTMFFGGWPAMPWKDKDEEEPKEEEAE